MSFLTKDMPAMKSPTENPKPGAAIATDSMGEEEAIDFEEY